MMKRVVFASVAAVALTASAAMAQQNSVANWTLTDPINVGSASLAGAGGASASGALQTGGGESLAAGGSLHGQESSAYGGVFVGGVGAQGPGVQSFSGANTVGISETFGGAFNSGDNGGAFGGGIGASLGVASGFGYAEMDASGTTWTAPLDPNDDCSVSNQGGCPNGGQPSQWGGPPPAPSP